MKIYDITREMMGTPVYPGDPSPRLEKFSDMSLGDSYNLSALFCCVHNGTHLDSPLHFLENGDDVSEISLEKCIGECLVVEFSGTLLGDKAEEIVRVAPSKILFKGAMDISPSAAFVFASCDQKLDLIGVEASSVAMAEHTRKVHVELLEAGIVLLENLDLSEVKGGRYMLFAQPLKIKGSEGSPVRALLLERQI